MQVLSEIKKVIELEINSLKIMEKSISKDIVKIVNEMHKCKGKIIVTGMGKSGIIAEKIVATLTSTGTPSIFLHPAEGMHGDLGIVKKGDIVLAITKSGESDELIAILPSIKKIGAKIFVISSRSDSTLSQQCNRLININVEKEACPFNLAPTCSSTAALVLGDAIAVTLMKMKKFKSEHFALYHPGGRLGKRLLLKVKDIMRKGKNNPIINLNDTVAKMLIEITKKGAGAVTVVDKKTQLLGLVTDFDIRKILEKKKDIFKMKIKDIMNYKPKFIYEDEKAAIALEMMENRSKPFTLIPVLNKKTKKVTGMIHLHDILSKGI
ncbi:SIS domain-containing protein [bacterium]